MLNNTQGINRNSDFQISKFWVFRLINIFSILSIFIIFSILLIPISYFNKERSPSILDLDLNFNSFSHAIKINTNKLHGNILAVSFTTHNCDHIIGTTTFGEISLVHDHEYLSRFVVAHYKDKRRGLPIRVVVIDAYPNNFIFKKFILFDFEDGIYKQVDAFVYSLPSLKQQKIPNLNLYDLINSTPKTIFKVDYEDTEGRIITHYSPNITCKFDTIIVGEYLYPFESNSTNRTITTVSNPSYEAFKVIITTLNKENSPIYKEFYFSSTNPEVYHDTLEELCTSEYLALTQEDFEVKRYEDYEKTPVDYPHNLNTRNTFLTFDINQENFRYEIVTGDLMDTIIRVNLDPLQTKYLYYNEEPIDRLLVLEYSPVPLTSPSFYIFDRMLYYSKLSLLAYSS